MNTVAAQLLEECIEQLKRGQLTEERLRELGKAIGEKRARRQSLLYLQTATTSVTSQVIGMLLGSRTAWSPTVRSTPPTGPIRPYWTPSTPAGALFAFRPNF